MTTKADKISTGLKSTYFWTLDITGDTKTKKQTIECRTCVAKKMQEYINSFKS